ncbi:MAG: DUF1501 domain-containing protein [Planctomycetes bacterium]|nr:DUF1501 domain-containing protein [Planctomycetota bacterium]
MFRIACDSTASRRAPYCDGVSRRSFLQIGMAGIGSLGLADILRAKEASAAATASAMGKAAGGKKNTSVILLWLDGGPSHIDTYDMKPEAPAEYRGIWSPIKSNVPGMEMTELFPLQAKIADKFSVIRSIHHDNGDHFTGGHYMLTGKGGVSGAANAGKHPFIGAAAVKMTGPRHPAMPAHVAVPHAMSIGLRPGYFGGHYLGKQYDPFDTGGDPNGKTFKVQNLSQVAGLDLPRLQNRRSLLSAMDNMRREIDNSGALEAADRFDTQAYELVTGARATEAFDISKESDKTRDRYGRHSWAQSALLARRLVEAGTTFVSVHSGGWDHHWNLQSGYHRNLPIIDQMTSALIEDLDQRGLLDTTLVLLCGEFGRTPKMNDGGNGGPPGSMGTPGRDHWGNALSVLIAGGGVKGGRVIGSTDARGERPKDHPLTPGDLHATIFDILGVDKEIAFNDFTGRPTRVIEQGDVIRELF